MKMRKITAIIVIFCFTFLSLSPSVCAEGSPALFEAVSPLGKGDKAPFEGILFSKALAAKIEADRRTMITLRLSDQKVKTAVLLVRSELQLKIDVSSGKFLALEEKHRKITDINREQIDFLRKQYLPAPWYEHPAFLVTIGIVSGVALTIGAAHIVKTVK